VPKPPKDLASLVSAGRAGKGIPASREEVLEALLRKRAAAWRGGMDDLEAKLRNQILWSLPVEKPAAPEGNGSAANGRSHGAADGSSTAK
jgi:hypothetical protein